MLDVGCWLLDVGRAGSFKTVSSPDCMESAFRPSTSRHWRQRPFGSVAGISVPQAEHFVASAITRFIILLPQEIVSKVTGNFSQMRFSLVATGRPAMNKETRKP